jgi:hypothetical protein
MPIFCYGIVLYLLWVKVQHGYPTLWDHSYSLLILRSTGTQTWITQCYIAWRTGPQGIKSLPNLVLLATAHNVCGAIRIRTEIFPEVMLLVPRWSVTQEQFYIPCWFFPMPQMNDKHSSGLFPHLRIRHSGRTCTSMVMGSGYKKDSSMEHYRLLTMGPLCKKSRWTSALPL